MAPAETAIIKYTQIADRLHDVMVSPHISNARSSNALSYPTISRWPVISRVYGIPRSATISKKRTTSLALKAEARSDGDPGGKPVLICRRGVKLAICGLPL
jgi:hypothetical protein